MRVRKFILAATISLGTAIPAFGQAQMQPVVVTSATGTGAPVTQRVGNGAAGSTPMPVTGSTGGPVITTTNPVVAVAGTQNALSIASATAPTIPAGATYLLIQAQGANNSSGVCAYWQDDGTNPTGSAGQSLSALQSMWRKVSPDGIKLIQATGATCAVTISYYKDAS